MCGLDSAFFGPDRLVGVRVYRGNADGSVSAPLALAVGNAVTALGIGDMNEDGKPDLVAAIADSGLNDTLVLLPGVGDGSFGTAISLALAGGGPGVQSLAIAGYSGDGHADVLLGGQAHSSIVRGTGRGTFGTVTAITIANLAAYVKAADLDNDGKVDAVAAISLQGLVPLVRTRSALAGVTPPTPEPFTLTASSSSGRAASGQAVTSTLGFVFAAGFTENISLSCGALPANTVCEFAPARVTGSASGASSVLTIRTGTAPAMASAVHAGGLQRMDGMVAVRREDGGDPSSQAPGQPAVIAWLLAAALPTARRRAGRAMASLRWLAAGGAADGGRWRRSPGHDLRAALGIAVLTCGALVAGCGNGGDGGGGNVTPPPAPPVTPSGTYDITVTATAPGSTRSFTYRLTVE